MCKVYTGYCGTSEIEHGLCACTVDNPLAKARGLSLRTGAQTMLYLSHVSRNKLHVSKFTKHFFSFCLGGGGWGLGAELREREKAGLVNKLFQIHAKKIQ